MGSIYIVVSDQVHKRLKVVAALKGKSMRSLLCEVLCEAVFLDPETGEDQGWEDHLKGLQEEKAPRLEAVRPKEKAPRLEAVRPKEKVPRLG